MEVCTDMDFDETRIEACRTCGIYYTLEKAIIRPIYPKSEVNASEPASTVVNMSSILKVLSEWQIEITQDDGRPQYICVSCISEFQRFFKFKQSCIESQDQFGEFESKRMQNGMIVKTEVVGPEQFCGFIYIDDDDGEEDGSTHVQAAFDIPHVPIKEEHMARVPREAQFKPPDAPVVPAIVCNKIARNPESSLDLTNDISSLCAASPAIEKPITVEEDEDDDDANIVKFIYDDEDTPLPLPIEEKTSKVFCKICSYESETGELHLEHMRRIHLLKCCECHICGKKFENAPESRFKFHMKWHKLGKHIKCPTCTFYCDSKEALKEHKIAVHTRVKCKYCVKQIKPKLLQQHLNQHLEALELELARKKKSLQPLIDNDFILQCAFCNDSFRNLQHLEVHVKEKHPTKQDFAHLNETPNLNYVLSNDNTKMNKDRTNSGGANNGQLTVKSTGELVNSLYDLQTSAVKSDDSIDSSREKVLTKSLSKCHICGKMFDLQFKLNKHLKTHAKSPT